MKRLMLLLGVFLMGAPLLWAQSETPIKKVVILEVVDRANEMPYGMKLLLRTSLAKAITQTKGYEGYDRVDMEAIMGEQDFQRTGMVSDEQIKRLGEMTGAAYVLVAEVAKIDANNMLVTAKILDVESAKLERTDYEQMATYAKAIAAGCRKVAQRLFASPAEDVTGYNTIGERKVNVETAWQSKPGREPKEKVKKNTAETIELGLNSKVIRKGASLFVEDRYMVQTKMPKTQVKNYMGNYLKSWQAAKTSRAVGISLFATGSALAVWSIPLGVLNLGWAKEEDYYYYVDEAIIFLSIGAIGGALMLAGIPTWAIASKKMNRILQAANEQHGIAPYRTAASLHIGNQPHGVGLGIRF